MVKNLNLIGNSTASPSVCPSAHPSIYPSIHLSGAQTPLFRNVLKPNRLGELTNLVQKRFGAETSRTESSVNRQNAVLVVLVERRVVHMIIWL